MSELSPISRVVAIAVGLSLVAAPALLASTSGMAPRATCNSVIDPVGSFSWRPSRVVLGVAAVPPAYIPQTAHVGGRWPYWSKAGLAVRANSAPLFVIVPKLWRKRVAITWGDTRVVGALRFETCSPSSSLGNWNPYSGGFLLRWRAACVPLVFRVGERTATVRFGVGKRC